MLKLLLTFLVILPIIIYGQEVLMNVAIFDQHPTADRNFEPEAGSMTKGMVKSALNSATKIPELVSQDPSYSTNLYGRIVDPAKFKYFFASDYTSSRTNRFLNTTIPLTKVGDYYQYFNDYFFPIDGTHGKRLGFDAEPGYSYFYDTDNGNAYHNYHFCIKMNTFFKFKLTSPPMKFAFRGDDDVWVYINNILAMDLGGLHYFEDGEIVFDQATATALGLVNNNVYSFDFYYCERHTTGSHMGFQINFPLDCSQKDYCGVCFGSGECCNPSKCTKYASNKCKIPACPPWNTTIPDLNQISNYCTYTDKSYQYLNDKCFTYTCDPTTGNPIKTARGCEQRACQSSSCTDGKVGCVYTPTCVPADSCSIATCGADKTTCNRGPKTCSGPDICKEYYCDTSLKDGCTSRPKCDSVVIQNGVVNKCQYRTCNGTNGSCIINDIPNCNACQGTPNKCQVLDKCVASTGQWTFKDRPEINDNNACTKDSCDPSTGAITHDWIKCPGCSSCNLGDPSYACTPNNTKCSDGNACTSDICAANGTCTYTPTQCPPDPDKCSLYSCDPNKGCILNSVTCPDEGNCKVGYCDKEKGCQLKERDCATSAYCLEGYCDERLGCLTLNRTCTPDRPQCQIGICNNETATCEFHDRDPYPFICKTAAVVSTSVIAGVTVAGAVALALAVFGGKKGYDYWKTQRAGKIGVSNQNPLYESKPTSGDNPLYNDNK